MKVVTKMEKSVRCELYGNGRYPIEPDIQPAKGITNDHIIALRGTMQRIQKNLMDRDLLEARKHASPTPRQIIAQLNKAS